MAISEETRQGPWVKDYLLTWFSRFGFFLAHHVTRPLLPLYLATFGASSTIIGAVMGVFTLTATICRLPVGLLIDRIGRKPFLLSGITFLVLGVLGYFWAPSILLIVPFRILHGIGWSGCTTAVVTIVADVIPKKRRGELIGYAALASNIAGAIGPILGFAIFHRLGYGGAFLGATGILFLSLLIGTSISETKRENPTANVPAGWIKTIAVKETLHPALAVAFISFGHGGIFTFLPFHALQLGLENPGHWFAVYAICLVLSRPIAGPLSDRISRRAVILPGLIVNLAGVLVLAVATSPAWLIAAAVITGFGYGSAHPALMTLAVDQTSAQSRGRSLAQFQFFYDLGIGLGSFTMGAFLDMVDQNFSAMYLVTAGVAFLGLIIYWKKSTFTI